MPVKAQWQVRCTTEYGHSPQCPNVNACTTKRRRQKIKAEKLQKAKCVQAAAAAAIIVHEQIYQRAATVLLACAAFLSPFSSAHQHSTLNTQGGGGGGSGGGGTAMVYPGRYIPQILPQRSQRLKLTTNHSVCFCSRLGICGYRCTVRTQ